MLPSEIPDSLVERFYSKVLIKEPNECWPWLGHREKHGYGRFGIGGKGYLAHRVAYHLGVEQSNPSCVMHTCDNPPCCNFFHLIGGTQDDNMEDMKRKGRARGPAPDRNIWRINPPVGELHPLARLTWDMVREIRSRVLNGTQPGKELAREYGIRYRQLHNIVIGVAWKEG